MQSSFKEKDIYSRLLRCSAARGAIFGLSLGSPTKIKSFIFTENSLKVENKKNTCLISLSHFISSHFAQICQIVGLYKGCDQNCDRMSKNDKGCHIPGTPFFTHYTSARRRYSPKDR